MSLIPFPEAGFFATWDKAANNTLKIRANGPVLTKVSDVKLQPDQDGFVGGYRFELVGR